MKKSYDALCQSGVIYSSAELLVRCQTISGFLKQGILYFKLRRNLLEKEIYCANSGIYF